VRVTLLLAALYGGALLYYAGLTVIGGALLGGGFAVLVAWSLLER
jgi:hypothetical protein